MALIALTCPKCGAKLEVEEGRDTYFCSYCGTKFEHEKTRIEVSGTVNTVKQARSTQINDVHIPADEKAVKMSRIGGILLIVGVALIGLALILGVLRLKINLGFSWIIIVITLVLGVIISCIYDKRAKNIDYRIGKCPHCDVEFKMDTDTKRLSCPVCNHLLVVRGDELCTTD